MRIKLDDKKEKLYLIKKNKIITIPFIKVKSYIQHRKQLELCTNLDDISLENIKLSYKNTSYYREARDMFSYIISKNKGEEFSNKTFKEYCNEKAEKEREKRRMKQITPEEKLTQTIEEGNKKMEELLQIQKRMEENKKSEEIETREKLLKTIEEQNKRITELEKNQKHLNKNEKDKDSK